MKTKTWEVYIGSIVVEPIRFKGLFGRVTSVTPETDADVEMATVSWSDGAVASLSPYLLKVV